MHVISHLEMCASWLNTCVCLSDLDEGTPGGQPIRVYHAGPAAL